MNKPNRYFLTAAFYWCGTVVVSGMSSLYGKTTRNIATQVLQGTGVPTVDLNQYNLPIDVIREGWTVNFVQKATESSGRVKLEAKTNMDHYVELITLAFPRNPETGGLGIELEELAGGRPDGIGITIVAGLVEDGSAEEADLQAGDVLSSVSLIRRRARTDDSSSSSSISETQEEFTAATDCLDYDSTVKAIGGTIPALQPDVFEDTFVLEIKRLRRLPKITVKLRYPPSQNEPDGTITLRASENLRQGMLVRGVKLNDPLAKRFDSKSGGNCGAGGLCRTCSVCVMAGQDLLNPQRLAEQQALGDTPRWRLACKAVVGHGMAEGELVVNVNPNRW